MSNRSSTLRRRGLRGAVARIAQMEPREIYVRIAQEVWKRWDLGVFWLGLRHEIEPSADLPDSDARFFFTSDEIPEILDLWRRFLPEEVERTVDEARRIMRLEFDLLGYRNVRFEGQIDWHLDPVRGGRSPLSPWFRIRDLDYETVGDEKIIWELNRHHHLVVLAKAFLLTRNPEFLKALVAQWRHWREHNPYPWGINWASNLEVAFRSLSWVWVDRLLKDQPETPAGFIHDLRLCQALNGRHIHRYLSTYSTPNTHLLGEAVALFFLGVLYPSLPGASRWMAEGRRIVEAQALQQVRPDGVYFEQSSYYHVYALDFFLHAGLLAANNGVPMGRQYTETLEKMLDFIARSSQAGVPVRMGDDDGGRVFDPRRNRGAHMLDPLPTGAVLFERPEWKAVMPDLVEETLWTLGPKRCREFLGIPVKKSPPSSRAFRDSGIYVMACSGTGTWQLTVDAGPQGTGTCGHGHADALSVQLAGDKREWLVDSGTYAYKLAAGRDRFRCTAAHNTLEAEGLSQADPVHPFAWANLPQVHVDRWVSADEWDYFRGSHTGYERLRPPLTHRRIIVRADNLWLVIDQALGSGEVELMVSWHFAPDLELTATGPSSVSATDGSGHTLSLVQARDRDWRMSLEEGLWSPAYGAAEANPVARFRRRSRLPISLATALVPGARRGPAAPDDPQGVTLQRRHDGGACVYELRHASAAYRFVFGDASRPPAEIPGSECFSLYRALAGEDFQLVGSVAASAEDASEWEGAPAGGDTELNA